MIKLARCGASAPVTRDSGARCFNAPQWAIRMTIGDRLVVLPDCSLILNDTWHIVLQFLPADELASARAVNRHCDRAVGREFQRRRRHQAEQWRTARATHDRLRHALIGKRSRLLPLTLTDLDARFAAALDDGDMDRAWVLVGQGASSDTLPLSVVDDDDGVVRVNFASIVWSLLHADGDTPLLMAKAKAIISAAADRPTWAVCTSDDGSTAFDLIMTTGVRQHPDRAVRVLALMASAGFTISNTRAMHRWTDFVNRSSECDPGVRRLVVRMAFVHQWFDLSSSVILAGGPWNRFPSNVLGAIPSASLLHDVIVSSREAVGGGWSVPSIRKALAAHGQSSATVLEYFQRLPHTRRLFRRVLHRFDSVRRAMIDLWPETIVALVDARDFASLRLLVALEHDRMTARLDANGNTVWHYVAGIAEPRAIEFLHYAMGTVLSNLANEQGDTPIDIAKRNGVVADWGAFQDEPVLMSRLCNDDDDDDEDV